MYWFKVLIDINFIYWLKIFKQAQSPDPHHKSMYNLDPAYLGDGDNIMKKDFPKYSPKGFSVVMVKITFPGAKALFTTRN